MHRDGRSAGWRALVLLVAAALVLPVSCSSGDDHPRHTIGILRAVDASPDEDAFFDELARLGIRRGDLRVRGDSRGETHPDTKEAQATVRRWVDDGVDLVVALSTSTAMAAATATQRVPIVFLSNDAVATGLVADPRRPERNSTGVSYRVPSERTLALAEEALGDISRVGCLFAADDVAAGPPQADLERGARALGMSLQCAAFHGPFDLATAVEQVVASGVDVIEVLQSPTTVRSFPELERVLAGVSVPVLTNGPADFAVLTLRPDGAAVYRQLAAQAARLLRGRPVADVPVEDPGHYLLEVNLRIARRIGRTLASDVVERADRVIR